MRNAYLKFYLLLSFLIFSLISKAQNYNISILPARLAYNTEKQSFSDDIYGIELYLLYKYVEIERKLNSKYSVSLGLTYSKDKDGYADVTLKSQYINIDPNVRYYFNKKNNMSGFYAGSGVNYINYIYESSNNIDENNNRVSSNRSNHNILNFNIYTGYKLALIKNRFSIDLKLQQQINVLSYRNINITYSDGSTLDLKERNNFQTPKLPFLDLKLGYRFGFKK